MLNNIASIRSAAEKLIEAKKDVVIVLYSGGGFLGLNTIKDLTAKARYKKGKKGGIIQIMFLSDTVFPKNHKHRLSPFTVIEIDQIFTSSTLCK